MKTTLLSFFLLLFVTSVYAQQAPREGALIALSQYEVNLKQGESATIQAEMIISKRFKAQDIDGLVVQQKEGLTVNINEKSPLQFDVELTATEINGGTFPLIIKAEGKKAYKVKQTMLMVTVSESPTIAKNQ
jgi:hypothetical protein